VTISVVYIRFTYRFGSFKIRSKANGASNRMEASMSRVEWALLCDLAYFDAYRNLCMIGVQTQPVPSFPADTRRFTIAARVPGLGPHPTVAASILTPDGAASTPTQRQHLGV
jgi:hypothetical protein